MASIYIFLTFFQIYHNFHQEVECMHSKYCAILDAVCDASIGESISTALVEM